MKSGIDSQRAVQRALVRAIGITLQQIFNVPAKRMIRSQGLAAPVVFLGGVVVPGTLMQRCEMKVPVLPFVAQRDRSLELVGSAGSVARPSQRLSVIAANLGVVGAHRRRQAKL